MRTAPIRITRGFPKAIVASLPCQPPCGRACRQPTTRRRALGYARRHPPAGCDIGQLDAGIAPRFDTGARTDRQAQGEGHAFHFRIAVGVLTSCAMQRAQRAADAQVRMIGLTKEQLLACNVVVPKQVAQTLTVIAGIVLPIPARQGLATGPICR